MIGQSFLNKANVVALVVKKDEVKLFDPEMVQLPQVDGLPQKKITLQVKDDVIIPENHIGYVKIVERPLCQGEIYVERTECLKPGQEYCVPSCVISADQEVLPVLIFFDTRINFKAEHVLGRGELCLEDVATPWVSALSLQTAPLQPFTMADISKQVDETLPKHFKRRLLQLLNEYRECFAENSNELGVTHDVEMYIKLSEDKPITYRRYRLAPKTGESSRCGSRALDSGIVEESDSPYASPILLKKKRRVKHEYALTIVK